VRLKITSRFPADGVPCTTEDETIE
jgi:hypothetical protein